VSGKCLQKVATSPGVGHQDVDIVEFGELDRRLDADLGGVRKNDDLVGALHHAPLHRRLVPVGGRQPVAFGDAVRTDEGDIDPQVRERVGFAHRRLGQRPHASAEHLHPSARSRGQQLGRRQRVGEDDERAVHRDERRETTGRRARVQQDAASLRDQGQSREGDALLLAGVLGLAGVDGAFGKGEEFGGYRTAVHTPQQARAIERLEVAANGLRRDIELFGGVPDGQPAFGTRLLDECVPPLLGVHGHDASQPKRMLD
jgi:hypothetical protein